MTFHSVLSESSRLHWVFGNFGKRRLAEVLCSLHRRSLSGSKHCLCVPAYRSPCKGPTQHFGSFPCKQGSGNIPKPLAMSSLAGDTFFLDEFAFRQFEGGHAAQLNVPKEEFVQTVHKLFHEGRELVEGYAPFCKHLFVPNFTGASVNALAISPDNEALLRSGYSRRRPDELAVLTRWFPEAEVNPQKAKFLDLILYSREQLVKEYDAMPEKGSSSSLPDAPWGIISIKPQDEDYETPMQPITIMRNSLGKSEGGSGVPLDRKAYEASVKYWQEHAPIIAGNPSGE